jgi:hypothetical protein
MDLPISSVSDQGKEGTGPEALRSPQAIVWEPDQEASEHVAGREEGPHCMCGRRGIQRAEARAWDWWSA